MHALPVLAALRAARPDVAVDWLVDARYAAVLALVEGCARAWSCARGRAASREARTALRRRRWATASARAPSCAATTTTAALDLQGLIKSAVLARASGARRVDRLRHARSCAKRQAAWGYTETVAGPGRWPRRAEEPRRAAGARRRGAGAAGVSLAAIAVRGRRRSRWPSPAVARAGRFAMLNPGAAWPNKRWPPARFGELAARLGAACGLPSVVTWGGDRARRSPRRLRRTPSGHAIGLAGDDAERPARPVAPGQPRGERRHRSAAPGGLGRARRWSGCSGRRARSATARGGPTTNRCRGPATCVCFHKRAVPARARLRRRHQRWTRCSRRASAGWRRGRR